MEEEKEGKDVEIGDLASICPSQLNVAQNECEVIASESIIFPSAVVASNISILLLELVAVDRIGGSRCCSAVAVVAIVVVVPLSPLCEIPSQSHEVRRSSSVRRVSPEHTRECDNQYVYTVQLYV